MSNRRQSHRRRKEKKKQVTRVCVCVGFPRAGSYQSSQSIHHLFCFFCFIFIFIPPLTCSCQKQMPNIPWTRYWPNLQLDSTFVFNWLSFGIIEGNSWEMQCNRMVFIHSLCINRPPDIRSHLNCISSHSGGGIDLFAGGTQWMNVYITHIYEWTSSFFLTSPYILFRHLERRGRRWFVVVHNQRNVFFPFLPLNKLTAAQPMCTSVNLLYQKESLSYLFYWIIFFYYLDVASCCLFCLIHQTTISYDWESIVGYRRSRNAGCLLFRQHLIVQNVVVIFFLFRVGVLGFFFSCKMAQSLA